MCLSCVYCPAWLNNHRPQKFSEKFLEIGSDPSSSENYWERHKKLATFSSTNTPLDDPPCHHSWQVGKNTIPASTCHHLGGHCYNWLEDSPKREIVPESMRTLIIHWRSSCWIFFCLLFSCLHYSESARKNRWINMLPKMMEKSSGKYLQVSLS